MVGDGQAQCAAANTSDQSLHKLGNADSTSEKRCRASSDGEVVPSKHARVSERTALQLRVGVHTYLPVLEGVQTILQGCTDSWIHAEVASGVVCLLSNVHSEQCCSTFSDLLCCQNEACHFCCMSCS